MIHKINKSHKCIILNNGSSLNILKKAKMKNKKINNKKKLAQTKKKNLLVHTQP